MLFGGGGFTSWSWFWELLVICVLMFTMTMILVGWCFLSRLLEGKSKLPLALPSGSVVSLRR